MAEPAPTTLSPSTTVGQARGALPFIHRAPAAPSPTGIGLLRQAETAFALEDLPQCQRLLAPALVRLGGRTDPVAARCLLAQARVWLACGQWREFRAELPALESFLQAHGSERSLVELWAAAALLDVQQGRVEWGELDFLRRWAAGHCAEEIVDLVDWAAGLARLTTESGDGALAVLARFTPSEPRTAHRLTARQAYVDLVRAALAAGRPEEVRELLADSRRAEPVPGSPTATRIAHGHALLAVHTGDQDADPAFRTALAGAITAARPFDRARLRLEYGTWLRARDRGQARVLLTAALADFERLRCPSWANRTLGVLRAEGVRPTGSGSTDAEAVAVASCLNARQIGILRMVGDGLSNRTIAEQLWVSPRTIASHLYRLFPQIGVRSRGEVRDFLLRSGLA